ncbi:choice-of-anchor Q domain-containing protein [Pedosphaera parvula]|uniref:Polymorphic outer membrane protein n=1 Tax=Pedosphaera parvula (strain Ellin514) TaxID=320771 RepID=B9XC45_PEDPL|nr:choice-of-anchor Q domain-containing protein [Pedosphaera parvula]EEF62513.1 hypothetical protein Cflav_PD5148 [Pedosphaera parvula Ellin514]
MGGAIFNHNGWLLVTNSTLVQNKAQGGTGGAGNSEGTGNAQAAGDGGSGFGGSIFNLNGVVTICSSTFASNVVVAGAGGLSNPGVTNGFAGGADGGALYTLALSQTASVTLINSILANSSGGKDLASRGSVLTATEPNIVRSFTNSGGGFTTTGVVAVDPLLGPLTNNGGFAYTMALLPGSPALDAGDSANAPVFDGRGLPRVSGAKVDLGAYELQVPTQLLFTNWKFVSGGGLQLQFSGSSGTGYTIVSTTDLTLPLSNWTVLGSAIETTNGEFQFNDTQAMSFPQRSYRVRQP